MYEYEYEYRVRKVRKCSRDLQRLYSCGTSSDYSMYRTVVATMNTVHPGAPKTEHTYVAYEIPVDTRRDSFKK